MKAKPDLFSENLSSLSRQDWVSETGFEQISEDEVLRQVAARVKTSDRSPLVALDLDSTLYEVAHRTRQILSEWFQTPDSSRFRNVRDALSALPLEKFGYSLQDSFLTAGLDLESPAIQEAWAAARQFWSRRFFTSAYLPYDRAYAGVPDFVRHLYEQGAGLVYLTGRDKRAMRKGTEANLIRDGFPWNQPRTWLLMKDSPKLSDHEYKSRAAETVRGMGELVASFENEPVNLVTLFRIFPDAMHIFVDTVCSDRPAPVCRGLYRIARWNWVG
jgi:hypothetical protein